MSLLRLALHAAGVPGYPGTEARTRSEPADGSLNLGRHGEFPCAANTAAAALRLMSGHTFMVQGPP